MNKNLVNKVVEADEAIALIHDGDTLCNSGFVGIGTPDGLLAALERRFLDTGSPRDLTLVFAAGQGDGDQRGLNRLGQEGLVRRVIGGHWGLIPKIASLALTDKVEAYNLPQGCISQLYRETAAGRPGLITKVGLGTFVDPRIEGGKINKVTQEDIVELIELRGQEWLFYPTRPLNIAFLRGTSADAAGNISMEREAVTLDNLAMAMAVKNCGGLVIAQVERFVERGSLSARMVKVPGVMVDCVVQIPLEMHNQTYATVYNPVYSQEIRAPSSALPKMNLDTRKLIARRAAFALPIHGLVNLGIGMPEGVAAVAAEEDILDFVTLTTESGVIGGFPASGLDFGAAANTEVIIDQNQQFDFYDGGGLDLACLGMAQADSSGNVNVSCFNNKLAGAGGFINISQNARRLVFVGTFTTGGLKASIEDSQLKILKEGRERKFVAQVDQITFSGLHAGEKTVLYVTERCVFCLKSEGLELIEIAPGIDIERDILAHMGFTPIIKSPRIMDPAIFHDKPMDLKRLLVDRPIKERISYHAESNTLFLNFDGLAIRNHDDIRAVREAVEETCRNVGKRVEAIVNYDAFHVSSEVINDYVKMAHEMVDAYYSGVSRYTTSAFMRMKLGDSLTRRGLAPHIFETREEARRDLFHVADQ